MAHTYVLLVSGVLHELRSWRLRLPGADHQLQVGELFLLLSRPQVHHQEHEGESDFGVGQMREEFVHPCVSTSVRWGISIGVALLVLGTHAPTSDAESLRLCLELPKMQQYF